jgi:Mg-chelatase subunit ChlD
MKTQLVGITLFTATAVAVGVSPLITSNATPNQVVDAVEHVVNPVANERPKVEVVFVLDTTGSMGGLIEAAKEKIWSIASTMAAAQPAPEIRMGLVAYRDRGDDYVTKIVDLSSDLDSVYATLMDFRADGGGDGPESVNQALHDAINNVSWSQEQDAYKVVFLVGDAPSHMDYQDDVKYKDTIEIANTRSIVINTIQCGQNTMTTRQWQQIAELGSGRYFQVEQSGSAIAVATPYDDKIAELSKELDETRLFYGDATAKKKAEGKTAATDKLHALASTASRARRAVFNASESGKENLTGDHDLVEDIKTGRVDLSTVPTEELPAPMQALSASEQEAVIEETAERRQALQQQIKELGQKRDSYLKDSVGKSEAAAASLDHKIYSAVREQAEKKGMSYEAGPAY